MSAPDAPKGRKRSVVQRLTFECGHLQLSGPWDSAMVGTRRRHMIGDLTCCYVCPQAYAWNNRREWAIRQVVNVEEVWRPSYRRPDEKIAKAQREQRFANE